MSERGHRTLLVSTDPAHSTSDVFACSLGPDPTSVAPNLDAMEIDPVVEADRYIAEVKKRIADSTPPRLAAEVERQIDVARVTPGAEESALFDRFTRIVEFLGERYDRILFDTAPLGHTLRLLSLPELMGTWISGLIARRRQVNVMGRMWRTVAGAAASSDSVGDPVLEALQERRDRFERARTLITDVRRTGFIFVVIPEHLPVAETERAVRTLSRYRIPIAAILVNQVSEAKENGVGVGLREREAKYLERIRTSFRDYPVGLIPVIDGDLHGMDGLRRLIAALPGWAREQLP